MLEVKKAEGSYTSANVIKDININIQEGEIKAILGRNGVGKSTLMRYLAGVLPKRSGEVLFQGVKLPERPSQRAKLGIAYVPQGREIFPRLTVVENIKVSAFACGHDGDESIQVAFHKFPALENRAHVMGGKLSGGQQQILALARALAMKPKLILLDEPTEGIQPSIISEIQEILLKLNQEEGITMLFTEQNLDFAKGLSKSCYLMDKGTIQMQVPMSDLDVGSDLVFEMLGI